MGKFKKKETPEKMSKGGRIGRLDDATLGYYRRVSETIENGFENDEERDLFLNNVLIQLSEEVLKVSQNQTVSSIVENLTQLANAKQLQQIAEAISKDWETACCDRFASHVTEKIVLHAGKIITRDECDNSETKIQLQQCIDNLWSFLLGSFGLYMQHIYASHVIRTLIEVIGVVHVGNNVVRSRVSQQFKKDKHKETNILSSSFVPSENSLETLAQLTQKILSFNKLTDYLTNSLSNPVIQTLMLVLKKRLPKFCDELCNKIVPLCFKVEDTGEKIEGLVTDQIGSHLVEQLICISSTQIFTQLFDEHIKGNLCNLALHNIANFVVQKIIIKCHTQKQFETVFKELHGILEDLLAHNHLGVVVKLAEGAILYGTKQEKLVKSLMKAFHCYKPVERQTKIFPLIASLTTYDIFYKLPEEKDSDDKDSSDGESDEEIVIPTLRTINFHGSMLLQKLLQFGNPRLVVNSLLELKAAEISMMSCDPCGSHIIDAFLKSKTVGEKSREHLVNKMKGYFGILGCDKHGSRTLDTLWNHINIKQKIIVADDLVKQKDKLRGNRFGFYVWRNCALENFIQRRKEWTDLQTGAMKKRKMFKDIIESPSDIKKRKIHESYDENSPECNRSNLEGEELDPESEKKPVEAFSKKRQKEKIQSKTKTKQKTKVIIKDKTMQKLLNDIQPKPKEFKKKKKLKG